MPLPATVRVKLSSEAAGAISLTPVILQDLSMRDLLEQILGVTGKDEARIHDALRRGTLVSGASRYRWQGWEAELPAVRELLATFPDPEPTRAFAPARCERAVLRGGRSAIELAREAVRQKGLFQRVSFWDALMEIAASVPAGYAGYSYRDRCDRFIRELSHPEADRIRAAAELVKYSTLRGQIQAAAFTQVELFALRDT
jgi:hypothetical protein